MLGLYPSTKPFLNNSRDFQFHTVSFNVDHLKVTVDPYLYSHVAPD